MYVVRVAHIATAQQYAHGIMGNKFMAGLTK